MRVIKIRIENTAFDKAENLKFCISTFKFVFNLTEIEYYGNIVYGLRNKQKVSKEILFFL